MNALSRLGQTNIGAEPVSCEVENRSIKVNLQRQRDQLQERLKKINAALDALNSQPEVAELLEAIIKVI